MSLAILRYADCYSSNLKRYLDGNGISTNSLANKSNISQKTIWVVQAGKSVPTVNTVQSISKALSIDSRVMLHKELSLEEMANSVRVGKIMEELVSMTREQIQHVSAIATALAASN